MIPILKFNGWFKDSVKQMSLWNGQDANYHVSKKIFSQN